VGLALLVVLDRLTPAERLAFVLHDMFAVRFEEIARPGSPALDKQRITRDGARRALRQSTTISHAFSSPRSWSATHA
jgi:RNA polymerase sigma-70 factor, ECF subfamily